VGRKEYWIQKAIKKPGALSKQLGIPMEKNIPASTLRKIVKAETYKVVRIDGLKRITPLLKKRASLALTLRKFNRGRS